VSGPRGRGAATPIRSILGNPAVRRAIKWTVYGLLIVHWGNYLRTDVLVAAHVLREGGSWLAWTGAFASTFDASAWLLLLFVFELETYALSEETFGGFVTYFLGGLRILCYIFLAHTIYVYATDVGELYRPQPLEGVVDLCEIVGGDLSFTRNLEYTVIDQSNCAELSSESEFLEIYRRTAITDRSGLQVERQLMWADLVEAIAWLLIVLTIELVVQLQDRKIHSGPLIAAADVSTIVFYGALLAVAGYWAYRGHWFFVWDEFVWIAGFAAIEMNLAEWREDLAQGDR